MTATHIKGVSGCLGDPLEQLAGAAGAPLDVRTGSQDVLQHAERQGFPSAGCSRLAHHGRVDQTAQAGQTDLSCGPQLQVCTGTTAPMGSKWIIMLLWC